MLLPLRGMADVSLTIAKYNTASGRARAVNMRQPSVTPDGPFWSFRGGPGRPHDLLALVLRQGALAQPDRPGRNLDELVVLDVFQSQFEGDLPRRFQQHG